MDNLEKKIDDLAKATAKGFAEAATKEDLQEMREHINSDVDILLDKHLQTYMRRYDELAHRVKRLEEHAGLKA